MRGRDLNYMQVELNRKMPPKSLSKTLQLCEEGIVTIDEFMNICAQHIFTLEEIVWEAEKKFEL